jgi:hypothetical protein
VDSDDANNELRKPVKSMQAERNLLEHYKVDEVVWYMANDDIFRQQAVVLELDGNTQLKIRLLAGPQAGEELVAPIDVVSKKAG